MADVVFIAVILGFFGLCVLYIRACDRLVESAGETTDATGEVTR